MAALLAPLAPAAAQWDFTKTANPTTYSAAGQTITYSYLLVNTGIGDNALSGIVVTDNKVATVNCPATTLADGASMTCTGTYTTTAADVTTGSVTNTATADVLVSSDVVPEQKTAQATITLRGTPTWTLTKSANPTTYSGAGQSIAYSYVLTNTGNVAISAITLTDNKITTVSCPATTLAVGAAMTCTGTYVTAAADVSSGSVVNTATANGTPSSGTLTAATATATVRYVAPAVTTGSITIVKTATGGNGAFNFTSTLAGATSFSLTTAGGTASRTFSNLTAGTYVFTEVNLPLNWNLTALTCTGDSGSTPNVINVASRSVSIGLDGGEAVVCTFTNVFDTGAHVLQTQQVIARFLGRRASLLASEEPDRPRFLRRIPGSLWGDGGSDGGGSSQPFNFAGTSGVMSSRMTFGTSLGQIAEANAYAAAKDRPAGKSRASVLNPEPGIDVWVEAHYAKFGSSIGNIENRGNFGIVYVGADRLATSAILVGALVQFDWMSDRSKTLNSTVDGRGTMAGPYVSARLTPNLFFDARAAWGLSNNQVNPFGTYQDNFSTDRWLAHGKLTGNWNWQAYRITPSIALDYVQEHQRSYTDSLDIFIPGQVISLGRLSFGPEIARRFIGGDGTAYEPLVALTAMWDFANPQYTSITGLPANADAFHAKLQTGLLARSKSGLSVRIVGSYDGVGSSNFHSYGGEFWLNIPFN